MAGLSKFFKQAYRIVLDNKFLWTFGLFLICGNLLFAWLDTTDLRLNFRDLRVYLFSVISIMIFILYFRGKAAVITSIKTIIEKQPANFRKSFEFSRFFYSRVLGVYLLLELTVIIVGMIIGAPIEYLFSQHDTHRAVALLILGLVIFIPLLVIALLMNILAPMFVVIFDLKIREALERSFELISKYWMRLLLFGITLILVELPALFLGAFVLGLRGGMALIILGTVLFLALESSIGVFQQAVWVLLFLDLIRPQKFEEAQPEIVPEIIN